MNMLKGVYILVISVGKEISINVGALGEIDFRKGLYTYVGSSQTNLAKRIERHLKRDKRKFWHIDYLLDGNNAKVLKTFFKKEKKSEECKIAKRISERSKLIKGFGSSDCNCKSHLFWVKDFNSLIEFIKIELSFIQSTM